MLPLAELERDLKIFADPATDFSMVERDKTALVDLIRDGQARQYLFDLSRGTIDARHASKRYSSIAALLSSDEFANIRTLRATQRRLLATRLPPHFIPPEGELVVGQAREDLSIASIESAVRHDTGGVLSILLLDGPAGIGKTSLIENLVYKRSDPASNQPPLLHVTSSGSRLTDLSKALAHATQVLRASITFDQVPILVRRGVLQVAIDGFDELVDPSGYKDAWSALREFLGEVARGGPTILSGRDTFFDQQSFQKKLAERVPNLDLRYARLRSVSPHAAKDYLLKAGWPDSYIDLAEGAAWFTPGSYRLRPFFLSQIAGEEGWEELQTAHGSPQAFLVNRFVTREARLLARFLPISVATIENALWNFYCILVEDMAIHEMDTVDTNYLALALETSFNDLLSQDDLAKLVHRAGSVGLLESDTQGFGRKFPHTEIQNQFLAKALIDSFESNASIGVFIRRVPVTMALLEAFADRLSVVEESPAKSVIAQISRVAREEAMMSLVSANATALLLASTSSERLVETVDIESATTNEVRLFGVVSTTRLREVHIGHLDARGADLSAVTFESTTIGTLTVDETTQFGATLPTITSCIQVESPQDGLTTLRSPGDMTEWLRHHRLEQAEDIGVAELPLVKYFDRLCRKFIRQRQIRNSDTDAAFYLIRDRFWPDVKNILGERLISDTGKNTHGTSDIFFRLTDPEALLKPPPGDPDARRIRNRVVDRARELRDH
jgi:hypothetical protein